MAYNTREQRRRWEVSGAVMPEAVARWKRYADPINARLMEKWKDGVPVQRQVIPKRIKLPENIDWRSL